MHREFGSEAEIDALAARFEDLSLPKEEWTHAAHFATALWLIRGGRAREMPAMIRAYNESVGGKNTDTEGYHETITQASLRAAHARLAAAPGAPLHEVANALLRSELGRSDWLLAYWTRDLLFSVAARRAWVAPDIAALPYPDIA